MCFRAEGRGREAWVGRRASWGARGRWRYATAGGECADAVLQGEGDQADGHVRLGPCDAVRIDGLGRRGHHYLRTGVVRSATSVGFAVGARGDGVLRAVVVMSMTAWPWVAQSSR